MSTVNVGNSTSNPVPVNVSTAIAAGSNTIGNVNIQASGSTISLGQAVMASSLPVVIASNQSNLPANIAQINGSTVATAATGIMKIGLTDGTGTAITSTSNAIDVNIKSGGGSGFSVTDEAAWTAGTSSFVPAGGVYNDTATALTSGQEGSIRLTNNRAIHVNLRDASANQLLGSKTSANSIPVVVASDQGAVPVSQSGSNWSTNVAQIGGTNIVTGGASGLIAVGGPVASGSSNADNPVKTGGVYNSTQPTVTTGQIVDAQMSARGAQIVATGADTFNVTVNAALPAGSATIGAVTQASGPWTSNITQVGGSALALGQTTMSASIPVTFASNQSSLGVTLPANNTTMIGVTSPGGVSTTAIAAAATNTVVKSGAGRLCRVLITSAGTAALTFYDNATGGSTTGNILGYIPANAAAGSVYDFQFIASTGIQVPGGTNTPAVTVGYI